MTSLAKCPTHGIWRKSAALLLIGPGKGGRPAVLTVKRSKKATFMPNNVVFPGGLCEPSDFSLSWLDAYPQLRHFTINPHATYPDIFINDSTPKSEELQELSPHIGFRITAIRELVEETGLMIDKKSGRAQTIPDDIRHQIHQQPERFCEIAKSIDMSPDIWALHDWSTWLTPTGLQGSGRRYDTHFYVAITNNIENLQPTSDNVEVTTVKFWDVAEVLKASLKGEVLIAPPQMYELARLLNFNTTDEVQEYGQRRDRLGTERIFPVKTTCSNGSLSVFPGDSLYPTAPDLLGVEPPLTVNATVEECMKLYPKHHRLDLAKGHPPVIRINIALNLQQLPPIYASPRDSKL